MTTSVRRAYAAALAVLALALGAGACSGGSDDEPEPPAAVPSGAPSSPAVRTDVSIGEVTGALPRHERRRLADRVGEVVDGWVEAAYLGGRYPRRDFADSWPGFTVGAKDDARRDKALMSNQDIGERIDGVQARRSQVRVDVLAVRRHAVAATARVVLRFRTTGDVERDVRVQGRLYLTPTGHGWRVFGYDMTKGAV